MRDLKITKRITPRDSDSVSHYLKDINRYELLSTDEEINLATDAKAGSRSAFEKLVNSNLRFVVSVAKQYQGNGLSLPDMINEGNIGLIEAVKRFDPSKGFKFISYAIWWIRQSIICALQKTNTVYMPANFVAKSTQIERFKQRFLFENERLPSNEEIRNELGLDPLRYNINMVISFSSKPFSDEDDDELSDRTAQSMFPKTDYLLDDYDNKSMISTLLSKLSSQEKYVIVSLFGIDTIPKSLDECGNAIGLSAERIRQIKNVALKKLQNEKNTTIHRLID